MTPYFSDDLVTLYLGDCLDVLATLPDSSVDAVVTDPPYGLAELSAARVLTAISAWMSGDRTHVPDGRGFMGREWDSFVPAPGVWDECMRVLKPGGHLLSFAGSRTVDLMTLSIRIAGFEVRDSISWLYGSGFPKSLDVSKAIDKAAGAERVIVGPSPIHSRGTNTAFPKRPGESSAEESGRVTAQDRPVLTAPATEDAARWSGWGTALKPAHEPIVVARKPLAGTVAANVTGHGTGALNIDGCRVGMSDADRDFILKTARPNSAGREHVSDVMNRPSAPTVNVHDAGRWPPNVLFTHAAGCAPTGTRVLRPSAHGTSRGDGVSKGYHGDLPREHIGAGHPETVEAWDCAEGCPVAELDRQSGTLHTHAGTYRREVAKAERAAYTLDPDAGHVTSTGDTGGASRFFPAFRWQAKAPAAERPRLDDGTAHPTVKPLALMRWLVRLVTPPGGTVLDPFAGSGTTGEACALEGFSCLLIERDPVSAELAVRRLGKPVQAELLEVSA